MKNFKSTKSDIVVQNGTVHIPSIFMFKGGPDELFPFLYECGEANCTVVFDNEQIELKPTRREGDVCNTAKIMFYALLATLDEVQEQLEWFRQHESELSWPTI